MIKAETCESFCIQLSLPLKFRQITPHPIICCTSASVYLG